MKLVSAMRSLGTSYDTELQDIEGKLTDLSITVEKDKCLNAGGRFEWVDSVLVKVSISFIGNATIYDRIHKVRV